MGQSYINRSQNQGKNWPTIPTAHKYEAVTQQAFKAISGIAVLGSKSS